MATSLQEVFGLSDLRPLSYVDRGALDQRAAYLISTRRHVAIHGDSKQGKSWLRERVLPDHNCVRVQCGSGSTSASVLQQALGLLGVRAEIRHTAERQISGQIDLGASGEFGARIFAKAKAEGKLSGKNQHKQSIESAVVGRTPADLPWIAYVLHASGRHLVLEDFHYLPASEQQDFSFHMKGLGEYDVPVVVVGVWAEDHLLSYHNGDLSGRVEDIRLTWTSNELESVLHEGSRALNIEISPALRLAMVEESFGNVGLLQRLAERTCMASGVYRQERRLGTISDFGGLAVARGELGRQMAGRFATFAERLSAGRGSYLDVLRVLFAASDADLLRGIELQDLSALCNSLVRRRRYSATSLRERLLELSSKQADVGVFPPVLAFDQVSNRIFLVDRAFLFYRRFGSPVWPWELS